MFSKVLIANRGAIACRIIRTLKALGVQSVAVYSEADAQARHVREAHEAYLLGPAPAAESYLRAERILQIALDCGAEAIHPGYGFLSENPGFAQACEDAGIAFIGPTPEQMRAFGLKHTARDLAEQRGVPLLPGTGLLADAAQARAEALRIGYPVMLKSTAGGGGIGMRLVWSEDELSDAFASVQRLASANFKDAGLFLEKYVEQARHIEVQVFGDGAGTVLALGERDCSVQRRNQKVIEETPAPGLTNAQRSELHATAVRLAQAVNYRSAGTVEFVYDAATGQFYFLEVNTRLQVEHGVTEQVTGVDLVAWMVQLAAGDLPPLASLAPTPQGAAIQVRLYAEDPAKNFQPSAGLLTEVVFPTDARVDGWVERGTEVPAWYDPMLAKLWPPRAWPASRPTWATCARWCATRCSVKAGRSRASSTASTTSPRPSRWWSPACRPACRTGRGAWATGTWACRPAAPWTAMRTAWPTGWWAMPTTRPRWRSRSPAPRCASTPTR
jgi:urea carboxylase